MAMLDQPLPTPMSAIRAGWCRRQPLVQFRYGGKPLGAEQLQEHRARTVRPALDPVVLPGDRLRCALPIEVDLGRGIDRNEVLLARNDFEDR
jgi:hypothetical protein